MPQNSASTVASEIEAIIARAMQEYSAARGQDDVDAFVDRVLNATVNDAETQATGPIVEQEPEPETPAEIPINSTSILVDEQTSRFSSAVWFDNVRSKNVTLAGLGGIGSYVAFLLSRIHVNQVYLYDDDIVEAGNMSGQLYQTNQVGKNKALATCDLMSSFSNYYDTTTFDERFSSTSTPTDIMICGFDSMEARRIYYERWKQWVNARTDEDKKKCLFIDGRLAAESFQIFCIKGDDTYSMKRYETEWLFDDSEAEETICSYKQTSFIANMIGSFMVNLFVNFCANECNPLIPRDLPFFTEYTAETCYLKVIN